MSNKPQLLSGARGRLKVNGREIAYVTDVSISFSVNVRPIHTFGSINARSIEPLQTSPVQVTIGRVIPMNKGDGTYSNTSNLQNGIEPTINVMLQADDITIELFDKITNKTVANVMNCRFAGSSKNISASQLATERIQLMGIYDAGPDGQNVAPKIGL
jgi:hypothetical protein